MNALNPSIVLCPSSRGRGTYLSGLVRVMECAADADRGGNSLGDLYGAGEVAAAVLDVLDRVGAGEVAAAVLDFGTWVARAQSRPRCLTLWIGWRGRSRGRAA